MFDVGENLEDITRENLHLHLSKPSCLNATGHPENYQGGDLLVVREVKEKAFVALDICRLSFYHQTNGFESRSSE